MTWQGTHVAAEHGIRNLDAQRREIIGFCSYILYSYIETRQFSWSLTDRTYFNWSELLLALIKALFPHSFLRIS